MSILIPKDPPEDTSITSEVSSLSEEFYSWWMRPVTRKEMAYISAVKLVLYIVVVILLVKFLVAKESNDVLEIKRDQRVFNSDILKKQEPILDALKHNTEKQDQMIGGMDRLTKALMEQKP